MNKTSFFQNKSKDIIRMFGMEQMIKIRKISIIANPVKELQSQLLNQINKTNDYIKVRFKGDVNGRTFCENERKFAESLIHL